MTYLHLEKLTLNQFRSYPALDATFPPGATLILGENGAGKSNILEAIYMLATSKSFRNATDGRIIRWGEKEYRMRGVFSSGGERKDISLEYSDGKKSLKINGLQENRISNIIGQVFCVLFSFEDVHLIIGQPGVRRSFLDLVLSSTDQLYFNYLKTYVNVIRQKNRYLKETYRIDQDLLSSWNEQLVPAGSYVVKKRHAFVEFMNSSIQRKLDPAGKGISFPFRLRYRTNIGQGNAVREPEQAYRSTLEQRVAREEQLHTSIYGPHRDDFFFVEEGREIRHFGSVGEARLASILLKLAQGEYYLQKNRITPIFLMDDILLELDMKNMAKVLTLFAFEGQKIITTTERRKLPETFSCDRVFTVDNENGTSVLTSSPN